MKWVDEFRDPVLAQRLIEEIRSEAIQPLHFMEFCGGHTHVVMRYGLRSMLLPAVRLHSGPGCPVCVTSTGDVDRAIALAALPGVAFATFGDMIRVPGSHGTLQDARAKGADVRVVYSPLDALAMARQDRHRQVILLGVGFETTAPGVAAALIQAASEGIDNFSVFCLHKLTPPATMAILSAGEVRIDGIIGPGHVSAIIGSEAWQFLPRHYGISCAVAGFEPLDVLRAILALVRLNRQRAPAVANCYSRGVRPEGNHVARESMERVFEICDTEWRGLGCVPASGLQIREEFATLDAARRFPLEVEPAPEPAGCRCGEVLRGVVEPVDCGLFRRKCTPHSPIGPCMVSAEGACSAYYHYAGDLA